MDKESIQDLATEISIEVVNILVSQRVYLGRKMDQRLSRAIEILLSYKSKEEVMVWLMTPNKDCCFDMPVELAGSEFSFKHLVRMIEWEKYRSPRNSIYDEQTAFS